jgi:hypothetical protein
MLRELENLYWRYERFVNNGQLVIPILVVLSETKEIDKCIAETLKR